MSFCALRYIYIYTYIHIYIYLYQIYCFIHIYVFATTTTIASLVMLLTHWDRDKIIVVSQTTLYPNHAIWRPRNWSALAQILVWCLMALSWLSPKSCVIHVRTISQEMLRITVFDICCETTNSRLQPYLLGRLETNTENWFIPFISGYINNTLMMFDIYMLINQFNHDDVMKWKQFPRYLPFVRGIHWSSVNSFYKGQWRGVLMFSLICAWIKIWMNNSVAGDLRCHRAH